MYQVKISLMHPFTGDEMIYLKSKIVTGEEPGIQVWRSLLKIARDMRIRIRRIAGGRVNAEVFEVANQRRNVPHRFRITVTKNENKI